MHGYSVGISQWAKKCSSHYREAANHATDFTAPIYNIWKQQAQ